MGAKRNKTWRKSDQINADLPVGRTWIDDCGKLTELIIAYGDSPRCLGKVWVAYPIGCPAYHITSDGPGNVVKAWDKKVSYEREKARLKPNCADNF